MVKTNKKKGLGYTLFTIIAISIMLVYLTYNLSIKMKYVESTTSSFYRGNTLKEIKKCLERDFPRSVEVALKRALVELINNETYEGRFYNNTEDILFNLSIYGDYDGFKNDFMINSTITEWLSKYKMIASLKNIVLDVEINNYSISMHSYDIIKACFNISYVIVDKINQQGYNLEKMLCAYFSIENFEDPYITINSYENILSSFKLCNYTNGRLVGNEFYGIAYIPSTYDLSSVPDKDKYILVVSNLSSYINYDGFRGYVLYFNTSLLSPSDSYIYDVNISQIKNETFIAVSENKVWMTNIKNNEYLITCYFGWNEGINFLDRLKGRKLSDAYKVAAIIDTDLLPPELNTGEDFTLDVELF